MITVSMKFTSNRHNATETAPYKSEGENGPIIIEILGLPDEQKINKLRITEGGNGATNPKSENIPVRRSSLKSIMVMD